jgi:hypothetical protein
MASVAKYHLFEAFRTIKHHGKCNDPYKPPSPCKRERPIIPFSSPDLISIFFAPDQVQPSMCSEDMSQQSPNRSTLLRQLLRVVSFIFLGVSRKLPFVSEPVRWGVVGVYCMYQVVDIDPNRSQRLPDMSARQTWCTSWRGVATCLHFLMLGSSLVIPTSRHSLCQLSILKSLPKYRSNALTMLLIFPPFERGGGVERSPAPPLRLRLVKLFSMGLGDAVLPTA